MPRFNYRAVNADNKPVEGTIEEISACQAAAVLREEGLQVSGIEEKGLSRALPRLKRRLAWEDIALLNDQLLSITRIGLPLAASLRGVARDLRNKRLKPVVDGVRRRIESGDSIDEAFEHYRQSFPAVYTALLRAGERSGNLPGVLIRLSDYSTRMVETRNRLHEAVVYPLFVLVVAAGVFTFLLTRILPVYVEMYRHFDKSLPAITAFWLGLATFGETYWPALLAAFAMLLGGLCVFARLCRTSEPARLTRDRLLLRLPVFGSLFAEQSRARFSHTLALLLSSRTPIEESLTLAGAASGNAVLDRAAAVAVRRVAAGEKLAVALEQTGAFPHTFCWLAASGEDRGDLEAVLMNAAAMCDRAAARKQDQLTFLTRPVLIAILGAVVLFMLVSVYYPVVGIGTL